MGYYRLCSCCPDNGTDLSPLSVACMYQADSQLFNYHVKGITLSPRQVYDKYCKDLQISQYFHCSYEEYMNQIIDALSE